MPEVFVLDTPRYRGEFEIADDEALTALEWRWLKKISGYTLGTVDQGMADADPSLYIALAVVALVRAGRVSRDHVLIAADELMELPFDGTHLRYEYRAAPEATPDPPAEAGSTPAPPQSTGASSNSTSARPEPAPSRTGTPDSARSAVFAQPT